MGKAKFGVQTTAAPSIILFRNGDKFDKGTKVRVLSLFIRIVPFVFVVLSDFLLDSFWKDGQD